jgi:hypothetical protein
MCSQQKEPPIRLQRDSLIDCRENMKSIRVSQLGILCVLAVMCAGTVTHTQSSSAPAFEVASVKANPSRRGVRLHGFPGDRFEATNVPVRDLILIAYGEPGQLLPEVQMSGGPNGSMRIGST